MTNVDMFTAYEQGVHNLLRLLGQEHKRYVEALTYQQRLNENILKARLRGDSDTLKSERTEVIERLNQLALSELGLSFAQLCPKLNYPEARGNGDKPKVEKPTLRNVRSNYKWGMTGSSAAVDFDLSTTHTVRYKRDEGFVFQTIMLYVDGELEYKKQVFNPVERIEHTFEIDGVTCEFVCQFMVLGIDVIVYVGGKEVLHV